MSDAPLITVAHPSVPARTLRELVELSKTRPGGFAYGTGTTPHLAGELLALRTGAALTTPLTRAADKR